MKIVWALLIKDWKSFWSDKMAVLLTFMVPFVIIYVIGNIFGIAGGNNSGPGPSGIGLALVDETGSEIVEKMAQALDEDKAFKVIRYRRGENEQIPLTEEDVRLGIVDNQYRFALVFPEDAFSDVFGFKVKLLQNPRNTIETQMTEGLIQKNLMTAYFENIWDLPFLKADPELVKEWNDTMVEMIVEFFDAPEAEVRAMFREDSFVPDFQKMMEGINESENASGSEKSDESEEGGINLLGSLMQVDKENLIGNEIKNPQGVLIICGYSVMFLLFTLNGMASSLFEEKQAGIFLRLLSSPVTRSHILWSKYLFGIVLGMIQMLTMFTASWVVFRVDVFHSVGNLLVAMLFAAATCTSLGMLISSISKTPAQANGIGTLVIILMSAIGGAWFPVTWMPSQIQMFSKLTVVYWSVESLLRVSFEGKNLIEMLPVFGVLTLMTTVFISISLWRFRRGDLF